MEYHLGYYVHHHGSGHIMRALSIAKEFSANNVTFLGSGLKNYENIIPQQIQCIHLPMDLPSDSEKIDVISESCLNYHYAPIGIAGIRNRNVILTKFFADHPRLLFVVDTSAEIVALARLCSVSVIIMQQHGGRNDLAHQLAYDSAVRIIAPFPETISPAVPDWVKRKIIYVGGFSKYSVSDRKEATFPLIGILVGAGGTSIDLSFLVYLASQLRVYKIKAIGKICLRERDLQSLPENLELMGQLSDPLYVLNQCCVIIGNAGNNTVMEMATLNKRFVAIPEDRPFNEQLDKAKLINEHYGIPYILPKDILTTNWNDLIVKTLSMTLNWGNMINEQATQEIKQEFDKLAQEIY